MKTRKSKSTTMLLNTTSVATMMINLDMISLARKVSFAKITKMERAIRLLFV